MMIMHGSASTHLLEQICEVAVLPHVIFSLLEPVGNSEPTASELEAMIGSDPGFAAKTLVLANSGAYGYSRRVASLAEAAEILGFRTLRTLAMTAGTFEMFVGKNDPHSLRRRRWWRHSVDTATTARQLMTRTRLASPDEAFAGGLLHLLGKSLLDRYGGEDYGLVTERQLDGQSDDDAEVSVYGCDHVDLICSLAEQWHLPARLISALRYRERPPADDPLRASVTVSACVASAAHRGTASAAYELDKCPDWALHELRFTRANLASMLDEGIGAIANCQVSQRGRNCPTHSAGIAF